MSVEITNLEIIESIPEGSISRSDIIRLTAARYERQHPEKGRTSSFIYARSSIDFIIYVFSQHPDEVRHVVSFPERSKKGYDNPIKYLTPNGIKTILLAEDARTIMGMAKEGTQGWITTKQLNDIKLTLNILSSPR